MVKRGAFSFSCLVILARIVDQTEAQKPQPSPLENDASSAWARAVTPTRWEAMRCRAHLTDRNDCSFACPAVTASNADRGASLFAGACGAKGAAGAGAASSRYQRRLVERQKGCGGDEHEKNHRQDAFEDSVHFFLLVNFGFGEGLQLLRTIAQLSATLFFHCTNNLFDFI